jgi:glycosyltransferase involved in cell wall biosynthesis
MVEAFARLPANIDSYLVIVGAGTDEANLRYLADELGVGERTVITGRVDDADKIELLKTSTVFCMPSPVELQSIATLEAMASGQPIVAVDTGAVKELCQNNRNGFLCKKDSVAQVAAGLKKILTDKKLHDKFAAESLKIAKTHDLKHTVAKVEQIYQYVIDAKNRQL